MVRFSQFANAIHRLKSSKNRIALSLYSFLELNDNQKRNYGIVVDRVSEDGTFGEVKHFVDLAVDINSMFPVNVHLPQNIFADFAKEYFQILMAADIYDALISDRVYRRAIDHDRALDIIAENPEIKRWVFLALEKISLC